MLFLNEKKNNKKFGPELILIEIRQMSVELLPVLVTCLGFLNKSNKTII